MFSEGNMRQKSKKWLHFCDIQRGENQLMVIWWSQSERETVVLPEGEEKGLEDALCLYGHSSMILYPFLHATHRTVCCLLQ
jgi:hypothetical protein